MISLELKGIGNRHRLRTFLSTYLLKALVASETGSGEELLKVTGLGRIVDPRKVLSSEKN